MSPFRRSIHQGRLAGAALAMAAAAVLSACNLQITNQAEAKSEWQKDYTLAPGGTLEILNTNGVIDVEAAEGTKVSVTAERIAKAGTDAEAKQAADGIEIREAVSGSSIRLDAKVSISGLFGGSREVRFHVQAPKGTVLKLSNTNGNIDVRDMTGELQLSTTNGRIRGVNLEGSTRAETTNGVVDLDYAAMGNDGIIAETTNGRVVVTVPKTLKARVNARVTNGGITTENLPLDISETSRRRLTATLNGGGPEIRVETTNGGVTIRGK